MHILVARTMAGVAVYRCFRHGARPHSVELFSKRRFSGNRSIELHAHASRSARLGFEDTRQGKQSPRERAHPPLMRNIELPQHMTIAHCNTDASQ